MYLCPSLCYDGVKSGVAKGCKKESLRQFIPTVMAIQLVWPPVMRWSSQNWSNALWRQPKLIKYSPRREGVFKELKSDIDASTSNHSPGVNVLCPTMHADSFASIAGNYAALQSTWKEAIEIARDTETKPRIQGVLAQMKSFDFLFGVLWSNAASTLQQS